MRFLFILILGLVILVQPANALDFTSESGRDLEKNKATSVTAGASYKGFRAEVYAQTWNKEVSLMGWNLYAPVVTNETLTLRLMGGGYHYSDYDLRAHYKLGVEFEYMVKKDRSFVFSLSNKFDPWTGTFGSRPQFFTGTRFYF